MINIAKSFMVAAVVFLVIGMAWGIQMSAAQDHSLSPAHGHLNLLGFVVMAIMGLYYASTPDAAQSRLSAIHLGLTVVSVLVLVPGIVMAMTGMGETTAKVGSVLSLLAILVFGYVIIRFGVGASKPENG